MFIKLKLASGDEVVVNRDRIEAIERDDDDRTAFQVHVGVMHYLIDADEHAALLKVLNIVMTHPLDAADAHRHLSNL